MSPSSRICPRCHRAGFVRVETVIKGGKTHRAFYCGACDQAWDVAESSDEISPPASKERPDRSRMS